MASPGRSPKLTPEQRIILGDAIRAARDEMGMTQEEFADLLGVRANQPSRWERGHVAPQMQTVTLISRHSGWPLSRFLPFFGADELSKLARRAGLEGDGLEAVTQAGRSEPSEEEILDRLVEAALSTQQSLLVIVSAVEQLRRSR